MTAVESRKRTETIGDRIRRSRVKKGLSQLELGMLMQCRDGMISRWETSRHRPDVNSSLALAKHLDVSISYLLTGQE